MKEYLDRFVDFMINSNIDTFPEDVIQRAKMVLIDTLGVTIYATNENDLFKEVSKIANEGSSRVLGLNHTFADPMFSALINGASAHSKQLDEAHWGAGGHPASYVVPAVLSVAEQQKSSGKEVITSIILGYELAARLASAYKRKSTMHPCGTYGIVGSSGAIGKLLKQDSNTLLETIKLSANLTFATTASSALEGASVHDLFTGFTGYLGVMIPQLAQLGFRGEERSLEMVFGTVSGENFTPEVLVSDLGKDYEITKNFFKLHAVCGRNLSAITAFEELLEENKLTMDEIDQIKVETYKGAVDWCSNQEPDNELAAKFSIPFALAGVIAHGNLYPEVFKNEIINSPLIKEFCSKVEVMENEEMTSLLPKLRPAKVTVYSRNGEIYSHEVQYHIGEKQKPYTFEQIKEKFLRLVSPVLGEVESKRVIKFIQNIEEIQDINDLTGLINRDQLVT